MLFSVAGFATFGLRYTGGFANQQPQPQQQQTLPTVVDRFLTGQEIALILRQGRVVIESVYNKDCESCKLKDSELRTFTNRYAGFVILESVETESGEGWEKFQMVGSRGQIISLEQEDLSQDNLLDLFCSAAVVQPRECLLRVYDQTLSSQTEESTQ